MSEDNAIGEQPQKEEKRGVRLKREAQNYERETTFYVAHEIKRRCKLSGVKKIRVHDLRHSHASLLIELGYSPLLVSERLGDENIETTLRPYSHQYLNKQKDLGENFKIYIIYMNSTFLSTN